ncbi:MAG: hypothetical protein AAFR38_05400 [Planctomycetota bacterium]
MRPIIAASLFVVPGLASAQNLQPPAGVPGETGRFGVATEINADNTPGDANSSFKIRASGSYYLSRDVLVQPGFVGIEIAADSVTIDMNGYTIRGFFGVGGFGIAPQDGASAQTFTGFRLHNGHIREVQDGFSARRPIPQQGETVLEEALVEDMTFDVTRQGVQLDGGVVRRCAVRTLGDGVIMIGGIVRDSSVTLAGTGRGGGFGLSEASAVNCIVRADDPTDKSGFSGLRSSITECTAVAVADGFVLIDGMAARCYTSAPNAVQFLGQVSFFDCNFP